MAKNNLVFPGLRLMLALALLLLVSLPSASGHATPPPVPACNPFKDDGTVKSTRECECSQLKTDANYCLDPTEYLQLKVSQNVGAALLSGVEKFTGLLWFLDRLAVNFAQFALSGTVWTQIREALLGLLASILGGSGGVLDLIIRGPNGLFYLALILAGIIMIVPFAVFGQRPVKIERVFLWGVFIIALFIGSTQGFDLIGALEQLRVNLMETVLSGDTVDLSALVGAPMRATATEATTVDEANPLALPGAFADAYFPGVDSLDTWRFRVRVPTPLNNILDVVFPGILYQEEALKAASNQAMGGVLLALLSLLPAAILYLTGAVLMLLTAASLVLIIFFVAAIPLGFFEFGATILGGIARQYMGIVLLSLFTAIFIRILAGLGVGIFGNDFSLSGMVVYAGGLGLVFVALQAALRQAWKALDGSAGMVQNAFTPVFASAGNLPYTSGPMSGAVENGQNTLNSAVQTASMLAMGAATGGGSLLAAVPGFLAGGGSAPASPVTPPDLGGFGTPASAPLDPAAVRGARLVSEPAPGAIPPPSSAPATSPPPATSASSPTPHVHDRQPPVNPPGTRPFAPAHDPAYVTPDLQGLKDAEHAYFDAGDQVAARRLLAQGLGSNALADAMLEVYRTEGRPGAEKVRQVVEQAQDTATHHPALPLTNGAFTPAYLRALHDTLRQAGLMDLPMFEELAQASARRVTPVEELPPDERADLLAYAVAAPDDPLMLVEDAAAQYRLHDLAEKMEWEADKLKALFTHYDRALRAAKRAGQPLPTTLAQRLQADPAFAQDSDATRQEATRLAALVAEKAWIQLPAEKPPASAQTPAPSPGPVSQPVAPASMPVVPPAVASAPPSPASDETPASPQPMPQAGAGRFYVPGDPVSDEEAPAPVVPPAIAVPVPSDPALAETPVAPVPNAPVTPGLESNPVDLASDGETVPAEESGETELLWELLATDLAPEPDPTPVPPSFPSPTSPSSNASSPAPLVTPLPVAPVAAPRAPETPSPAPSPVPPPPSSQAKPSHE